LKKYANVFLPKRGLFIYSIPESLRQKAEIGKKLKISFRGKEMTGYLWSFLDTAPEYPTKNVIEISGQAFGKEQENLVEWIIKSYCNTYKSAIPLILPK